MNEQTNLFGEPEPAQPARSRAADFEPYGRSEIHDFDPSTDITTRRHRHSPTSDAAFEAIKDHAPNLRERVWQFIHSRGKLGATTYEVSEALGMKYTTVSARMSELKRDGRIVETGQRRVTDSNCAAAVMEAVAL
jgi:hypothetical protein